MKVKGEGEESCGSAVKHKGDSPWRYYRNLSEFIKK